MSDYGQAFTEWLTLRGQRVIVTLDDDELSAIEVEGVLIALDPYGEVELLCDDGKHHWCWPALDIRPSAQRRRGRRGEVITGDGEYRQRRE